MSKKYKRRRAGVVMLPEPLRPVWRAAAPYLGAILFFLAVCFNSSSTIKGLAVACVLLAIAATCLCFSRLRDRFLLPLAALALVVLIGGVSTLYAVSGKFALQEFLKLLVSFSLVLLLLAVVKGEGTQPGRRIASILERCAALAGLVSIDLLSTRIISSVVLGFLGLFTPDYETLRGVETGVRMLSMFDTPNAFAGFAGIGVLLSLGLVLSSEGKSERMNHVACLFINALAFVLVFSMGASAMIALAFLVYLAMEARERRAGLFVLMVETLILTIIAAALVSMTSFQTWDGIQPVPLLCTIAGAAALCLLDRFAGQRIAEKLAKHGKALPLVIVGVLAVLAVYILAAYNMIGGVSLQAGESLRRSAYPEPGAYTLTAVADAPVTVLVQSQNQQDTMMHTHTVLYRGELAGATFTVPEDSLVVYFNFAAGQDVCIESVSYEGAGGSGSVPLGYKLLPGFIANRLQGLFANQNAIQRLVFFEDGLKLFQRSPIFGLGLGCFGNGIVGVQSFYYETIYAHNHYIQTLAETGVIGLSLFVGLLVISAAAVWLARRKGDAHPLTPALGAALVFMAGHAATEVVFSRFEYLPMAFGVFALINLCCGSALPVPWLNRKVKSWAIGGCSVLMAAFLFLLCGNMLAAKIVEEQRSFDSLTRAVSMDKFEGTDYMLSYVTSVPYADGDTAILAQAEAYAQRLTQVDSNVIPIYLAEYYLSSGRIEQGLAMVEKFVNYVSADPETWTVAFDLLEAFESDTEVYRTGVVGISQLLEEWNAENMGNITLDEEAQAFIARMGA